MFRRTVIVVSLLLLLAGCQRATLTKVVTRTGIVVGELVATRPDAIVVRRSDGTEIVVNRIRHRVYRGRDVYRRGNWREASNHHTFRPAGRVDHANAKGERDSTPWAGGDTGPAERRSNGWRHRPTDWDEARADVVVRARL